MSRNHRIHSLLLALALTATGLAQGLASPKARAAIPPAAGEAGYLSAHAYATNTDIPGVYKITLSLQTGERDITPKVVYFVLDGSSSMVGADNLGMPIRPGDEPYVGNPAHQGTRWKHRWEALVKDALPAALEAMWGPNVPAKVRDSIEIGGKVYNENPQTTVPMRSYSPTAAADIVSDVAAFSPTGGTQIRHGLAWAYNTLSQSKYDDCEKYVMTLTDGLDFEIIMAVSLAAMLKAPESVNDVGRVYSDAVTGAGTWGGGRNDYGKIFNGTPNTSGGNWPGVFTTGQVYGQPNNGGRGQNARIWGASIALDSPTLKSIALRNKDEQYPNDGVYAEGGILKNEYGTNTSWGSFTAAQGKNTDPGTLDPILAAAAPSSNVGRYQHIEYAEDMADFFQAFGAMIAGYENAEVTAALNSAYFTPYQMKGVPFIETTNPAGKTSQGNIAGGKLAWTFDQPFDDNEYYTLSYYVILSPDAQSGIFYSPILSTSVQYGYRGNAFAIQFPSMYIGQKGIREEAPPAEEKGSVQHQGLLPLAYGAPLEYWISPLIRIKGVNGAQSGHSSAKVSVTVESNQKYLYQWQVKKDGRWENILGAVGSVATIRNLAAGKKYLFRCMVMDGQGGVSISPEIQVVMEKGGDKSAVLQSKD